MESSEFVNLPGRRVKPGQQLREEEPGAVCQTTVKLFSMENLGEQVCFRKKKIAREFGEEGNGDGCNRNDFLNQLAILEGGEQEVATESNSREMEHWLRKLHIRTHVTERASPATRNRLDAIHHVANTASRQSRRSTAEAKIGTSNVEDISTKPTAARSRGTAKQTTEHREYQTRKTKKPRNSDEQSTSKLT